MKRNFFYFAWREFLRSASKNKNMATKGVLIFFAIYFTLVALVMGFQLTENLKEVENPVQAFNALLLVYFGFELVLRVMMQNLPTFGFQPFLLWPVSRKRIARYMLNKSVLHFFNILPWFLGLPFIIRIAAVTLSPPVFWAWLASLFFMIFVNHFLALYIKWRTNESDKFFYGFLVLVAGVTAAEYFNLVDLTGAFGKIFDFVLINPPAAFAFPVLVAALYFFNQSYINSRFYLDELNLQKKEGSTHNFSWLNNVGDYGKMLSLEVKMIMRNKRPKNTAMMSVLFIFYGLLIYRDYKPDGTGTYHRFGRHVYDRHFRHDVRTVFPCLAWEILPAVNGTEYENEAVTAIGLFSDGGYQCGVLPAFSGLYVYYSKSVVHSFRSNAVQYRG
jgi:hypothetical protein